MAKFSPPLKKQTPVKEKRINFAQLALSEIYPDPRNDQIYKPDPVRDEALAKSIEENGILQPLLLRPHPTLPGKFMIVSGHRRYKAAQKNKLKTVPVMVLNATAQKRDSIKSNIQLIETNALTRNATVQENLAMIISLEKMYQLLRGEDHAIRGVPTRLLIAQSMGMSERQIADYLTVRNGLTDDMREQWEKGELTLTNALNNIQARKEKGRLEKDQRQDNAHPEEEKKTHALANADECQAFLNNWPLWDIYCKVPKLNLIVRIAELPDGSSILSYNFTNNLSSKQEADEEREHKHLWLKGNAISFEPTPTVHLLKHLKQLTYESEDPQGGSK